MGQAAEFRLQVDIDSLPQSPDHILKVEVFILKLLNLIERVLEVAFLAHLSRGLRLLVDEAAFEESVLSFDSLNALVAVLDFLASDLNFAVAIFDLLFEGLEVLLVLLLDFPAVESIGAAGFFGALLADLGLDFGVGFDCTLRQSGRFGLGSDLDLVQEGLDVQDFGLDLS